MTSPLHYWPNETPECVVTFNVSLALHELATWERKLAAQTHGSIYPQAKAVSPAKKKKKRPLVHQA